MLPCLLQAISNWIAGQGNLLGNNLASVRRAITTDLQAQRQAVDQAHQRYKCGAYGTVGEPAAIKLLEFRIGSIVKAGPKLNALMTSIVDQSQLDTFLGLFFDKLPRLVLGCLDGGVRAGVAKGGGSGSTPAAPRRNGC